MQETPKDNQAKGWALLEFKYQQNNYWKLENQRERAQNTVKLTAELCKFNDLQKTHWKNNNRNTQKTIKQKIELW